MPHEDYVPAPASPDYTFDPATLYQTQARPPATKPPEPPPRLSAKVTKIAVALTLSGIACLLVGERRLARAGATRGWMETTAVIATATLRGSGNDYHLDLSYRYRAGPREHQGSRLALEPVRSREAVYAAAERFRPGARVRAWFDPAAPESAMLELPNVAAPWAPSVCGMVLTAAGLAPLVRQLFRRLRYRIDLRRAAA